MKANPHHSSKYGLAMKVPRVRKRADPHVQLLLKPKSHGRILFQAVRHAVRPHANLCWCNFMYTCAGGLALARGVIGPGTNGSGDKSSHSLFLVLQTLKASEAATTSTRRRTGGAEVHPQPYLSALCALFAHFFLMLLLVAPLGSVRTSFLYMFAKSLISENL